MALEASEGTLLILGLGNTLCGDDGLGPSAIARLAQHGLPDRVEVLDGGTLGLSLLPLLEAHRDVILVDAVQLDEPPGSLVRLTGHALDHAARHQLSCHQVGVAELLDVLRLRGGSDARWVLLGLVPSTTQLGASLSPEVEAAMPALLQTILAEARARLPPAHAQRRVL